MTDDAATKKKATDDAEDAAATAALAWPTGGYDLFIPRLLILILAVYVLLIEGSILCSARASMLRYRYEMHTFYAMLTIYSWISLIGKVLIFPTIQKPYFRHFLIQGFAATLKPEKFTGTHFKRWQTRTTLWLTTMNVFWVGGVSLTEMIAPK